MKNSLKYLLLAMTFVACDNVAVEPATSSLVAANPDLAKYIAVGNSWTAGYMNSGLYRNAQLVSYPNLIAQQLKTIGGSDFAQPLFDLSQENGTGYTKATSATASINIIDKTAIRSTSPWLLTKFTGTTNNLGVVGLRMEDIGKVGLGNSTNKIVNAYFERLLPKGDEDKTYLDFVKDSKPTFFTVSLGDDDIQAYATSGGTNTFTDVIVFSSNCQKLLDALTANGAKGVIANVPAILQFPYFNYYTYDQFRTDNGNADIYIMAGNGLVRKAVSTDLFLQKGGETFGKMNNNNEKKGLSANYPMANNEVLDGSEIAQINNKITEINLILKKEADARNLPMVDLNAVFKDIKAGIYKAQGAAAVDFSSSQNGFFSLDAIHPTPRGYAVIANEFIKVMNTNYKNLLKNDVPLLDVSKFEGVKY
jgi:GDSL-like Lipase/Acylhydrolase